MKRNLLVLLIAAGFLFSGARAALAQAQPPPPADKGDKDKPADNPGKPENPGNSGKNDNQGGGGQTGGGASGNNQNPGSTDPEPPGGSSGAGQGKPGPVKEEKPQRPAASGKDQLLDSLTKGFQDKASEYQARSKDLLDQLKGAKGEEREKLRAALKALQEQFKEEKERFKDQVKEAKDKLGDLKGKLDEELRDQRDRAKPRDR